MNIKYVFMNVSKKLYNIKLTELYDLKSNSTVLLFTISYGGPNIH